MKEFKLVEVNTPQGKLYLREEYVKEDYINIPTGKYYELFTEEECEKYFNFIKFNKINKFFRYGDLIIDENQSIIPDDSTIKEIEIYDIKKILENKTRNGIDPSKEAQEIIKLGITKEEAEKMLKIEYEKLQKKQEKIVIENSLETFYKVFGDLFEDNIPTR